MTNIADFEKRIQAIEARNQKVELSKAWETSLVRKFSIALLTYLVTCLYFYIANIGNPLVNAVVPTLGFLLSTLSLEFIKQVWISKRQ